jgi:uncharacterized protein DUF6334
MSEEPLHQNLHPDLHPLLLEFHGINGQALRAVWRVYEEGCLDKIILGFDQNSLVVEAEPYDDTIKFYSISNNDRDTDGWIDATHSKPSSSFIGKTFGWGWITINQQDALDGILLSFDGIIPQVMLNVMASSIKESIIHSSSDSK